MTHLGFNEKIMNNDGIVVLKPNLGAINDLIGSGIPKPYEQSSVQLFPLGTRIIQGEREWKYCLAGGTGLDIAAPVQAAAAVTAEQDDDIVVGAASAIGATTVTITSTANLDGAPNNVANEFAEGYLIVNDEAGEGQCYKIKSNEKLSTTDDAVFTLYDPLTVALTTSSQVGIVMSPYRKVIATTAILTGLFIGIPQLAVTASYYFWCQTRGPAAAVANAAIAKGDIVVVGTTAALVDPGLALETTECPIGRAVTPAIANSESFIVFLNSVA